MLFISFVVTVTLIGGAMAASNTEEDIGDILSNQVDIGPNGISMPLKKILLVRKGKNYCAVKFTEFSTGENKEDRYASYESYCCDDKTGAFALGNVKTRKEELYFPKARWSIFGHPIAFGTKDEIHCGFVKLWWSGKGSVYFFEKNQPQGDYGIELAPTKWTDISQVNVFDQRLKWYKYDEGRKRENIPVNYLWKDKEK